MCGIIGYVGTRRDAELSLPLVDEGLMRVKYRGYDSAGLAFIGPNGDIVVVKKRGKLHVLQEALAGHQTLHGNVGIAHTRWATHGQPSDRNAHPHVSCRQHVAVVHNGIITNFRQLKQELAGRGHQFRTETDTEVMAHLIGECLNGSDPLTAIRSALAAVEGTYGLVVLLRDYPDRVFFARHGSPLLIGLGQDEFFVASDAASFRRFTDQQIVLQDRQIGWIDSHGPHIVDFDKVRVTPKIERIEWELSQIEKGPYPHFMLREICEQPVSLSDTLSGRLDDNDRIKLGGLDDSARLLRTTDSIIPIAAGTSMHAGMIGEILFQEISRVQSFARNASELANQQYPCFSENTLGWAISQSGETADLLQAIAKFKKLGLPVLGLTNVVGSSVARETLAGVYCHAGPEIGVASTKAFTSQVLCLELISLYLRDLRGLPRRPWMKQYLQDIRDLPALAVRALSQQAQIRVVAERYSRYKDFFFLGRGINYPVALEGALKLKEISYITTTGYACGEMKHGPLALINPYYPTVVIAPRNDVCYDKIISNISEITARGGPVLAIATEGDTEIAERVQDVLYVPAINYYLTPLMTVMPLQLLAYYIAVYLERDVDQPRHLAKSVTVE